MKQTIHISLFIIVFLCGILTSLVLIDYGILKYIPDGKHDLRIVRIPDDGTDAAYFKRKEQDAAKLRGGN